MVGKNPIDGSPSANSVGTTWFLAGSGNDLPSCTSCELSLPASGTGFFGSTQNHSNEQLSPNVAIVASNLSVHVDTAPGAATRKFFLFSHTDSSHSLGCEISGSHTSCNSGAQTLTIAPGTSLFINAVNLGNAPPTTVQLSWRAATP
jgi:hypothetical protein